MSFKICNQKRKCALLNVQDTYVFIVDVVNFSANSHIWLQIFNFAVLVLNKIRFDCIIFH